MSGNTLSPLDRHQFCFHLPGLTPNYEIFEWNARRYTLDSALFPLRDIFLDIFGS